MKGQKPEWATLPKRKCDDCGASYRPKQPLREGQRGFCTANCRKSYHKHGGAYRKLRDEVRKMVTKEFTRTDAEIRELRHLWIETEERTIQISAALRSGVYLKPGIAAESTRKASVAPPASPPRRA